MLNVLISRGVIRVTSGSTRATGVNTSAIKRIKLVIIAGFPYSIDRHM
jgi:hypothetical protein